MDDRRYLTLEEKLEQTEAEKEDNDLHERTLDRLHDQIQCACGIKPPAAKRSAISDDSEEEEDHKPAATKYSANNLIVAKFSANKAANVKCGISDDSGEEEDSEPPATKPPATKSASNQIAIESAS